MSRFGKKIALEGAEAVKGLYREWTHTDQCEVYAADCEELAVSDSMVVSSATLYQQTPEASWPPRGCRSIPTPPT